MTTEAKFKYALKEMMLTQPLGAINVTALCAKCDCHRQTFYYHYQDIYDLLAAIFLNENIPGILEAATAKDALTALLLYAEDNLGFLRSSYNSAGHDLVDDFFYNKIMTKLFSLLTQGNKYGLTRDGYRNVARRYAKVVGDEFGYGFKDSEPNVPKFDRNMRKFIDGSLNQVLPALIELSKEERKK